ncbi:GGDEF domain-containing protein [Saccharothrix algeriensis]|uniref:GGDEF domain-containing protein n=1 Tax=Saccharothrix algeriensis TaxID=173560 RepID=A0A8T8HYF2_9PSEU|nr:GGDEF domain-containing protein [Saccharothrix algeriensis]
MSVSAESAQRRIPNWRLRAVQPSRWRLWELPRSVLVYVLAVDATALLLVATTAASTTLTTGDLVRFGVLAAGALVHLEAARGIERLREVAAGGVPYVNLKSLWVFTGVIVLPLPLVGALVAVSFLYSFLRVDDSSVACRKVFSAATFVLASGLAAAVLDAAGHAPGAGVPDGPAGALVLVAAAITWWVVNFALVVAVLALNDPTAPVRTAFGDLNDQLVVAAALGLGIGMAALLVHTPWLVAVLMTTVLALHRGFLLPQLQRQAQTDGKTGLMEATYFARMCAARLDRLRDQGATAVLLVIDLDRFKDINDRLGHAAGDQVIVAVARALRGELRGDDLLGRFGGDEFVALLPGSGPHDVHDIGARLLRALHGLQPTVTATTGEARLPGLTASVGAALFPAHGATVDDLLLAADTAQQTAKATGGARLVLAPLPPAADPLAMHG